MQWTQLITYRQKEKSFGLQQKAIRALAGFLAAMVFCTILSRAAANIITPVVGVASPQKGALSYRITASGITAENQAQAVFTEPDLRVAQLPVKEGEAVEAGDTLFVLDLEYLDEKILEKEKEIERAELQMQDLDSQKSVQQKKKVKDQQRAQEDYDRAKQETDEQVELAYQAKLEAEAKLLEFDDSPALDSAGEEDAVLLALQQACDEKDKLLEEAKARLTELENNPEAAESGIETARQEVLKAEANKESADAVLEQFYARREASQSQYDREQRKTLEEALLQAEQAYQAALRDQEDRLTAANRSKEDAKASEASDSSRKIMELDREEMSKDLDQLKAVRDQQGVITSPVNGVIQRLNLEVGGFTSTAIAVSIADISAGSRFVAQIPREQQKYIAVGDEVVLEPASGGEITGLIVDTVTENEESSELLDISVTIPEGKLGIGAAATLTLEKKSPAYGTTLPLDALRTDESGWFVLVVKEKETVLGTELSAEPIYVKIKEKNEETAAVEDGTLGNGERVIISSDKPIQKGDRIRLEEQS